MANRKSLSLSVLSLAADVCSDVSINKDTDFDPLRSCAVFNTSLHIFDWNASQITFPPAVKAVLGNFSINRSPFLQTINAPFLTSITGYFRLDDLPSLKTVNMAALRSAERFKVATTNLTSISDFFSITAMRTLEIGRKRIGSSDG
jgi:hypothetical protein